MAIGFNRGRRGRGGYRGSPNYKFFPRDYNRGHRGRGGYRGGSNHKFLSHEEDWICSKLDCGRSNFASRTDCFRCSTTRSVPEDSKQERWKGDWDCPNSSCGLMNYAYREECCYCQTPRIMIKEDEIQDGLQLCVIYEKVPTLAESKIALHGLHSSTALKDGTTHILLFTSMEALEDAKIKLDADKYVKSVDYMGVRSASRQSGDVETRTMLLTFSDPSLTEESVKKLDKNIEAVKFTIFERQRCIVSYLKNHQVLVAIERFSKKLGQHGLLSVSSGEENEIVLIFSKPSITEETVKKMDANIETVQIFYSQLSCIVSYLTNNLKALAAIEDLRQMIGQHGLVSVWPGKKVLMNSTSDANKNDISRVILRDVPKSATSKDLGEIFPDAVLCLIFKATFPASEYCHAVVGFSNDPQRVEEILVMKTLEVKGKKIFPVPLHASLLCNNEKLGESKPEDVPLETNPSNKTVEPPAKKSKLENKEEGKEDDEASDEEGEENEGEEAEEDGDEEEESD